MTLSRLLNTIGIIGVRDKLVNFTGCGGSVYELNDLSIHNYPILYVSPTGTHRVEENYTTYQLTIFYIDRLLEDNSNAVDIHSAAVEILKNIIRAIENTDGVIGVSDEYSINLFTETEKFKDRCNGAYATVEISVVNDTVCEVGYSWNGEPATKKFIRIVTPANNNVNIPNTQNWFLFSWQTSEPSTHYSVLKCVEGGDCSVLMEGDTENTYLVLDPIVNDGTSKIAYNLNVSNEGGDDWREVYHLPNYFLNFTNRDNVRISAEAYDYLVSWNTNLETVEWKLYRNDKLYSSGQTTNTSIMAQFPVNTSNETVTYRFVAGSPGGGFERTLNWRQNAAVYYLNADEYRWIEPDESGVTIPFDTNCEGDIKFEWHYWNGETNIDLNETTWVYGTPMQVEVAVPSDRGNSYESLIWANAIYNGKEVGSIQAWCHNYFFKLQTSDNERIGSTATSYTINYETNYTGVDYTFGRERGTTSGGTLTLTFPENTGTSAVQMEVLFQDLSGNVLGTLHWTQNQADTYFNILTASGQTVSAAATAFTINYETNIQPPIHYVYTSPLGAYEGDSWNQYSLTINFSANDSQSLRERTVEIGGQTINWYQEVPYMNFTNSPTEITKDQQLVCFGWESNCDGKVKYELSSGATSEGNFNFVRSGRTDSMSGDCITFSANTGDDRYYKMDIYASFAGNDTNYVASDSATFRQRGEQSSGDTINSAITNNLILGTEIKDVDDIVAYGLYVFKWDAEDKYAKLTPEYTLPMDWYKYSFTDANVVNGVVHVSDAQRLRIVQAIPMADIPELSGATIYIKNHPNPGDNVYTGNAYLFYDIYNKKYFATTANGVSFYSNSDLATDQTRASVLCNSLFGDTDGNKIGLRAPNQTDSKASVPSSRYWEWTRPENSGYILMGTEQYVDAARPSGYTTQQEWEESRVSIIPVTISGSTHHYGYDPLRQITGSPQSNQIFYRSTTGEAVPYGLMQGWATDMDGNDMWATSNVYQNGYGIVTFPRPILSANAVVDTEQVVEIVWPEGMELMGLDIYSSRKNIESVTLPSTLRKIPAQFFYQSTIRYINIPSFSRAGLMKCMNANAFNGNVDNLEIYYDGTVAQWNALNKDTDWLYHKRSGQKVVCSDGLADA